MQVLRLLDIGCCAAAQRAGAERMGTGYGPLYPHWRRECATCALLATHDAGIAIARMRLDCALRLPGAAYSWSGT